MFHFFLISHSKECGVTPYMQKVRQCHCCHTYEGKTYRITHQDVDRASGHISIIDGQDNVGTAQVKLWDGIYGQRAR